jgi:hypothetical protein
LISIHAVCANRTLAGIGAPLGASLEKDDPPPEPEFIRVPATTQS